MPGHTEGHRPRRAKRYRDFAAGHTVGIADAEHAAFESALRDGASGAD